MFQCADYLLKWWEVCHHENVFLNFEVVFINHFSLQIDSSSNWRKKKIDRNTKITGAITGAYLGTTSSPGLFPSHFLRGKAWGRG